MKNAKSYELESEIEKFRGVFRFIVYRVQHIVRMRDANLWSSISKRSEQDTRIYVFCLPTVGEGRRESTSLVLFRRAVFTFRFSPVTPRHTVVRRTFLKVC